MHDRLAKLSGAEFDRAYVREMVAGHKKAVDAFTMESTSGKDNDVKAWATKTLPTVREHLPMIESIQKENQRRPFNQIAPSGLTCRERGQVRQRTV